ncbi:MAG TPA: dienelactone hydrolase family protein [Candidatus Kapabacteria bacterium]|nr:dienelactone hydrolase family protein [Candidatus Kapabacteria bacterium]
MMSDPKFVSMHEVPLPISVVLAGSTVSFACSDNKNGSGYFVKSATHPNDVVIMVHEWWGLNDYIKSEADRVSSELGVSVLAVDLYDGKVASTPDEAGKLAQSESADRAKAILSGAIASLGSSAHIATIGWCFGGGWSHQAALLGSTQTVGCVIYYGMPEMDEAKLKAANFPVLGIFGTKDQWINQKVVTDFQAAMKKAGKKLTVYNYDANHAFANPSNPHHDKKATADAWTHTEAFFRSVFKLK